MNIFSNQNDIRAAIDFLRTPLIIDVLWEVRNGRVPHDSPALRMHEDVVNEAVAALTEAGAVTTRPGREPYPAGPTLCLTPKGRVICALIDEVVDPKALQTGVGNPLNG